MAHHVAAGSASVLVEEMLAIEVEEHPAGQAASPQ
jgi:hypothetical protein